MRLCLLLCHRLGDQGLEISLIPLVKKNILLIKNKDIAEVTLIESMNYISKISCLY